jgi:hypothetical protein
MIRLHPLSNRCKSKTNPTTKEELPYLSRLSDRCSYLFERCDKLPHGVLRDILGDKAVGIVALTAAGLEQFPCDAGDVLLLSHLSKQLLIKHL